MCKWCHKVRNGQNLPHAIPNFRNYFSKNRPLADSFIESRCPCVCGRVPFCLVYFEAYFAPTSRSRMSEIFKDSESFGKSDGKKWSQIWTFVFVSSIKSPREKISFFVCWFCLTKHGGNHASRWIRDLWSKGISLILASLDVFEFLRFGWFFPLKKNDFGVFLFHPTVVLVLLSASVERCFVSRMRSFD